MKIFLILIMSIAQLFALSYHEAYQKAEKFEKNGDFKNAMIWYKKSATMLKSEDFLKNPDTPNYLKQKVKSVKQIKNAYNEYFEKSDDNQTNQSIEQILTKIFGLEPYETNYLLPVVFNDSKKANEKKIETNFQISFKKDIFSNLLGFDERYAFGYTQRSFWQTFQNSMPFRESNYQPEVFVYGFYKNKDSFLKGYQLGLLHESNGQGGESSRSWNRIYLKTFWQFSNLFVSPRIWYRIPERKKRHENDDFGDDNPDILDYLGYGDVGLTYMYKKQVFKVKMRNNLKLNSQNKGSFEFDWTFPLWSDDLYGYLRFFTGYGNSLDDYNVYSNVIGFGFAFSR